MARRKFISRPHTSNVMSSEDIFASESSKQQIAELVTELDLMGFDTSTPEGILEGLGAGMGYAREDQQILLERILEMQGRSQTPSDRPEWEWDDDDVQSATNVSGAVKKDYGGAFDVEPDMFFTKDDLIELTDEVLDHIQETFSGTFRLEDAYIEGDDNQDVVVEVEYVESGCVYRTIQHIDMRKIRKPSDLADRYSLSIAGKLISQMKADAQAQNIDVSGSESIQKDDDQYTADMVNVSCANMEEKSWPDMDWEEQIKYMQKYVRSYQGTRVFEDFAEHVGLPVEDIIDSFCDAEARGYLKVPQKKQLDSDYSNDDIYSASEVVSAREELPGLGDYSPTEYPEPIELDDVEEEVEIDLDAIITIDNEGSWTYEDESYKWARASEKEPDLYSDKYPQVLLSDLVRTVENVDSLLETTIPITPGKFRITGDVTLVYDLTNITAIKAQYEDGEDEIISEDVEVEFNYGKSYIRNFKINSVGEEDVNSSTSIEASSWMLDSTKKTTTPSGYTNFTVFSNSNNKLNRYRVLDNDVDNFDEGHEYMFAISKLSPYDDAKYVYCQYQNGVLRYAQDGKVIATEYYIPDDSEYEQFSEWQNDIISRCLDKLDAYNSKIASKIIHN